MKDSLIRAARTFVQAFLGAVLTSGVLSGVNVSGVVDVSVLSKVGVSALAAGAIALLSFVQNALEDTGVIPSTKGTN